MYRGLLSVHFSVDGDAVTVRAHGDWGGGGESMARVLMLRPRALVTFPHVSYIDINVARLIFLSPTGALEMLNEVATPMVKEPQHLGKKPHH